MHILTNHAAYFNPQIPLQWRRCADLPVGMGRPHSIALKGRAYIGGGITDKKEDLHLVFEYDPERDGWAALPRHPMAWFALGQFKGRLITVGGVTEALTGKVLYFDGETRAWEEWIQPMPTARCLLSIVTTESAIIACGGTDGTYEYCVTVEVYIDGTHHWHTTDPMPIACAIQRVITVSNTCYLLGGNDSTKNPSNLVLCASVISLIEKVRSRYSRCVSLNKELNRSPKHYPTRSTSSPALQGDAVWKILRDIPMKRSAGSSLNGSLLAIGGFDHHDQASRDVYIYEPPTNTWVKLNTAELPVAVRSACAVQLADSSLLVCGGRDSNNRAIKTVYIAESI